MIKKCKFALIMFMMLSISSVNCYAHFDKDSKGNTLKWQNTYRLTDYGVRCADVRFNGDYLNNNWKTVLPTATSNWNNNSDHRAAFFGTTYSSAKVRLATWQSLPSFFASNTVAWTDLYDINGIYMFDQTTGNKNSSFTYKVCGADIYTNPAYNSNSNLSSSLKTIILAHELGHVLCLGHAPTGTTSIMVQGQTSWSTPQKHDRDDLEALYPY